MRFGFASGSRLGGQLFMSCAEGRHRRNVQGDIDQLLISIVVANGSNLPIEYEVIRGRAALDRSPDVVLAPEIWSAVIAPGGSRIVGRCQVSVEPLRAGQVVTGIVEACLQYGAVGLLQENIAGSYAISFKAASSEAIAAFRWQPID